MSYSAGLNILEPQVISRERIQELINSFSSIGASESGSVSRRGFSDEDIYARNFFMKTLKDLGLTIRIDTAGNIIARLDGHDNNLPPIVTGSHLDTVPKGGKYDGTLGVIAGIEIAFFLQENNIKLNRPFEIIVFADEESTMIGCKGFTGNLSANEEDFVTSNSCSIIDNLSRIGGNWLEIKSAARSKKDIFAFLELHVEQGKVLEDGGLDIGIVNGIVGQKRITVKVTGQANHAGTTPMSNRNDALLAASKIIVGIEQIAKNTSESAVATVGKLKLHPNAANVIPGEAVFTIDMRDLDEDVIGKMSLRIENLCSEIQEVTGCVVQVEPQFEVIPTKSCDKLVSSSFHESEKLGFKTGILPSKASHDSQEIGRICPMVMIFVPSRNGLSHSYKEYTSLDQCAKGIEVLLNTIFSIDKNFLDNPLMI